MKSWGVMSDEWFSAIWQSSLLSGIFMIKKWVEFSLISFGTLKYDSVIKTRETIRLLLNLVFCY